MIKEKIYELLGLNEDLPIPEEVFKEFADAVIYGLQRQIFTEREERSTLRLSQIGKCLRQQYYSIMGYEAEPLNPRAKMTFLFGDIIEAVVVALAKASGVELVDQQREVNIDGVKGHIDGIVKDDGNLYLFECKSMSDASFKQLLNKGLTDDFGYLTQCNVYMHALGIGRAFLVAVNKNTGHITEVEIEKDEKLIKNAIDNIKILRQYLAKEEMPERKYEPVDEVKFRKKTGRKILPFNCAYCGYKLHCWDNLIQDFNNNKPIWVVE